MPRDQFFPIGANFTGTCRIYGRVELVHTSIEFSSPKPGNWAPKLQPSSRKSPTTGGLCSMNVSVRLLPTLRSGISAPFREPRCRPATKPRLPFQFETRHAGQDFPQNRFVSISSFRGTSVLPSPRNVLSSQVRRRYRLFGALALGLRKRGAWLPLSGRRFSEWRLRLIRLKAWAGSGKND
jgi:hypothetical protein